MVLLVVDTQKGCFNENLYSFEKARALWKSEIEGNKNIKYFVREKKGKVLCGTK